MAYKARPAIERWAKKVIFSDCCWEWNGYVDPSTGYGHFYFDHSVRGAHVFAYSFFVGPIPTGLHLDHLCRHRSCVNPFHLEPVTIFENLLRGDRTHLGRYRREKTHCPQGHEYDAQNTYFTKGDNRRICRTCNRERMAARRSILLFDPISP